MRRVEFILHPTNRGWTRDSGPVFVRRCVGNALETAIVHFHFNAWAKYPDWQKDRRVPETAAKRLRKRLFDAQSPDGRLRPGRRRHRSQRPRHAADDRGMLPRDQKTRCAIPGLGRNEFETALRENLGVTNIFWLGGGVAGDDTHGHVDDICRFVNPQDGRADPEDNPKDINYRPLAENWERIQDFRLEDGSKPEVVALPMPRSAVLRRRPPAGQLRQFLHLERRGDRPDVQRSERPRRAGHPGRSCSRTGRWSGIHAVDLVLGFGTLHCLTPAAAGGVIQRS